MKPGFGRREWYSGRMIADLDISPFGGSFRVAGLTGQNSKGLPAG
jgi:hypothetical protein